MPGVDRNRIAAGGASCGVNHAVQLARRSNQVRALLLLSGPTSESGLGYLRDHSTIAIFGAASSEEGLAVNSLRSVVETSKHPGSTMRVLTNAGHGVPMFAADSTLLPAAAAWVATVIK
jgi:hypothetical protein